MVKDIYHIDQTGLSTLIASFSAGALAGSITIGFVANRLQPARVMMVMAILWYLLVLLFVWMPDQHSGRAVLVFAGFCQSFSMVPLAAMLMRVSDDQYRGRVMGVRMLAIYGLPIGLMLYSPIMAWIGFVGTATAYCVTGLVFTALIAIWWRDALWPATAAGNTR